VARALYPGSFDPVTNGHLDIIRRGAHIFDEVIASVLVNPAKTPWFRLEERAEMLAEVCADIPNVRVESFSGLLVDHARKMEATVLLKGLRAVSDFESELMQAHTNRFLESEIDTLFIPTDAVYAFLSSSVVREVARLGGGVDGLVPPIVAERLRQKLGRT
jgi:pantetheine-phosphate adenylyltransferase